MHISRVAEALKEKGIPFESVNAQLITTIVETRCVITIIRSLISHAETNIEIEQSSLGYKPKLMYFDGTEEGLAKAIAFLEGIKPG